MRIAILSDERDFSHMLKLELEDLGYTVTVAADPRRLPSAALYLVDRDRFPVAPVGGRVLPYGRQLTGAGVLRRPFSLATLATAVQAPPARGLQMTEDAVILRGERIPLTAREHALLTCLVQAGGAPLSRRDLYAAVWGGEDGSDDGVVVVYLHYLRKKLERDGKKILYAVRGKGYALREVSEE